MSTIDCGACETLRSTSPEFIQNGVTDTIAASLKNNTGLNPSLTVTHTDCEDLNAVNDCIIGRLDGELEAYDVCDWKPFMHKLLPNLYETLKAIIAAVCGLWTKIQTDTSKMDRLCASVDNILALIQASRPKSHYGTWTSTGYAALSPSAGWDKSKYFPSLNADILAAAGCTEGKRIGRVSVGIEYSESVWPRIASFSMDNYSIGDIWGYWRKQDLVPNDMPEDRWNRLMQGQSGASFQYSIVGPDSDSKILYLAVRGYIVLGGVEYNADLKDDYGPDVLVFYPHSMINGGGASTFSGIGTVNAQVRSYSI